jgi:AraC-like DNA-binding protein
MQRLVVSTDHIPEAERFSYWREEMGERLFGFSPEPSGDQETPFSAHVVASVCPSLTNFHIRCNRHTVVRGPREIARRPRDDEILLYREWGAGSWFDYDRREFVTRPGDLIIGDPTIPVATEARVSFHCNVSFLPRKLLDPHVPVSLRKRSLLLMGSSGVAALVKVYLDALGAQIDTLDDRETDLVADNFCRLLAVACGANAGDHREAIHLARLEEAKRYIGLHLAEPGLTPEKAAGALKMSVRQLHLLFEPSGTSFAQYVLRRRLEECRAALASPIGDRSITDIALGWGFNSLWTFNRNFRQAFGVTPGEVRRDAAVPPQ